MCHLATCVEYIEDQSETIMTKEKWKIYIHRLPTNIHTYIHRYIHIYIPFLASPFPYQCNPAPGIAKAFFINALVSSVFPSPKIFNMTAAPTFKSVPIVCMRACMVIITYIQDMIEYYVCVCDPPFYTFMSIYLPTYLPTYLLRASPGQHVSDSQIDLSHKLQLYNDLNYVACEKPQTYIHQEEEEVR